MNSAVQASTGVSPFMMNYGREAPLPIDVKLGTGLAVTKNPAVEELQRRMRKVWSEATKRLEAAKERQKKTADKRRRQEEFKVGDMVWLSTENIKVVEASELKRSVKFASKFMGPFPVEQVLNRNAYRL